MMKISFRPGDTVAFSKSVVRRLHHPEYDQFCSAKARGIVLDVSGPVVRVDWRGTWMPHEDGGTIRTLPAANLTRVMPSGAFFED